MTHFQSINAAARLNDLLQERGWDRRGMRAFPTDSQLEVAVQYRSEDFGRVRVVACDPLKLTEWIRANIAQPGVWVRLLALLDRKAERVQSAQLPLFADAALPPAVKFSMNPNE